MQKVCNILIIEKQALLTMGNDKEIIKAIVNSGEFIMTPNGHRALQNGVKFHFRDSREPSNFALRGCPVPQEINIWITLIITGLLVALFICIFGYILS